MADDGDTLERVAYDRLARAVAGLEKVVLDLYPSTRPGGFNAPEDAQRKQEGRL